MSPNKKGAASDVVKKARQPQLPHLQIDKLSLGFGMTINLGNYESTRFDVGIECRVPEGVSIEEVRQVASTELKKLVLKQQLSVYETAQEILNKD